MAIPNLDFNIILNRLPDIYDKLAASNNYKIIQVLVEELGEMIDVFNSILDLKDINLVTGANLDLLGDDYGTTRNGRTDTDFRAFIFAKQNNSVDGNTIPSIINYLSFFLTLGEYELIELFIGALGDLLDATRLLDGAWLLRGAGFRRDAAFTIETDAPLDPTLEASLLDALDILKGAGVEKNINLLP